MSAQRNVEFTSFAAIWSHLAWSSNSSEMKLLDMKQKLGLCQASVSVSVPKTVLAFNSRVTWILEWRWDKVPCKCESLLQLRFSRRAFNLFPRFVDTLASDLFVVSQVAWSPLFSFQILIKWWDRRSLKAQEGLLAKMAKTSVKQQTESGNKDCQCIVFRLSSSFFPPHNSWWIKKNHALPGSACVGLLLTHYPRISQVLFF